MNVTDLQAWATAWKRKAKLYRADWFASQKSWENLMDELAQAEAERAELIAETANLRRYKLGFDEAQRRMEQAEAERDELRGVVQAAAEQDYSDEVVYTFMERHIIGAGKEYADKQDWIDSRIAEWTEEARGRKS